MESAAASPTLRSKDVLRFVEILSTADALQNVDLLRKHSLRYLMRVLSAHSGAFYLADPRRKSANLSTAVGYGMDFTELHAHYDRYYWRLDPFRLHPTHKVPVAALSDIVSMPAFMKSEFYNDFLKQQDILHALNISLIVKGEYLGAVALCRSASGSDFTWKDKAKASKLSAYLGTALSKSIAYERAKRLTRLLSASLQELEGAGVVLLDRDLNEVFSDERARAAISDLNDATGSPASRGTRANVALPEQLRSLCRRQQRRRCEDDSADGATCSAVLHSDRASYRVKLKIISGWLFDQEQQYLCVNIHAGDDPDFPLSRAGAVALGLTRRETEIVQAVAKGLSNAQIAEDLFISCNTVKNHLKNIFAKLGVRSRAGLLALFLPRH